MLYAQLEWTFCDKAASFYSRSRSAGAGWGEGDGAIFDFGIPFALSAAKGLTNELVRLPWTAHAAGQSLSFDDPDVCPRPSPEQALILRCSEKSGTKTTR